MRLLLTCCLLTCLTVAADGQESVPVTTGDGSTTLLDSYREAAIEKWEAEIKKLEALDASEPDPVDAILFIGSSSIRRWDRIATDMKPYRTIRRGYGGARYSDVAVFAKRLIEPHQYRALAMFVGNDVTGKPTDRTPDEVEALVRYIVGVSHAHEPHVPVLLIEITPTERRFHVWREIRAVNARLREIALTMPNTYFVATAGHYLLPNGRPRTDLFVDDQLHLNEQGYALWASLIRRRLDEVFRLTASVEAAVPNEPEAEAAVVK